MCSTTGAWLALTVISNTRKGRNSTAKPSSSSYTIETRRRRMVGVVAAAAVLFGCIRRGRLGGRGGLLRRRGRRRDDGGRRDGAFERIDDFRRGGRCRRGQHGRWRDRGRRHGDGGRRHTRRHDGRVWLDRLWRLDEALLRRRRLGGLGLLAGGGIGQLAALRFRQQHVLLPLGGLF